MFGRYVHISFKQEKHKIFVPCLPSTKQDELEKRANDILERYFENEQYRNTANEWQTVIKL